MQVRNRVLALKNVYALNQGFVRLVWGRAGQDLDAWLEQAQACEHRDWQRQSGN